MKVVKKYIPGYNDDYREIIQKIDDKRKGYNGDVKILLEKKQFSTLAPMVEETIISINENNKSMMFPKVEKFINQCI